VVARQKTAIELRAGVENGLQGIYIPRWVASPKLGAVDRPQYLIGWVASNVRQRHGVYRNARLLAS
jgi:hypothetical protein